MQTVGKKKSIPGDLVLEVVGSSLVFRRASLKVSRSFSKLITTQKHGVFIQ